MLALVRKVVNFSYQDDKVGAKGEFTGKNRAFNENCIILYIQRPKKSFSVTKFNSCHVK